MIRTISASRWSGLRRRRDPRPKAKTKTFYERKSYERKSQNPSAPRRNPASRWSAPSVEGRDPAFKQKGEYPYKGSSIERQLFRLIDHWKRKSVSDSFCIGNEFRFQAHSTIGKCF
jgi:hypothetical protein